MGKTEYKRDLHSNYMILSEGKDMDPDHYCIRMLEHNQIPGLLDCSVRSMDADLSFYYDISSRQPLSTHMEKEAVGKKLMTLIFQSLSRTLNSLSEYLLDADSLVLEPSMIYLDADQKELKFCYWPASESTISEQLRTLSEAMLPRLDQNDREAVTMGYKFYSAAMADEITMDFFEQMLNELYGNLEKITHADMKESFVEPVIGKNEEEGGEDYNEEDNSERNDGSVGTLFSLYETPFLPKEGNPERERKNRNRSYLRFIPFLLSAAILLFAFWMGAIIPGTGIALALAAGGLLIDVKSRKAEESHETEHTEERKKQDSDSTGYEIRHNRDDSLRQNRGYEICQEPGSERQDPEQTGSMQGEICGPDEFREDCETVLLENYQEKGHKENAYMVPEKGSGKKIILERRFYLLGKSSSAADLVIEGKAVSRLHAKLCCRNGEWEISDLNSRNGTLVNDRMLQPGENCSLADGDRICFADQCFVFHIA